MTLMRNWSPWLGRFGGINRCGLGSPWSGYAVHNNGGYRFKRSLTCHLTGQVSVTQYCIGDVRDAIIWQYEPAFNLTPAHEYPVV